MSLKDRLIPCLDVKDGRVVKGVKFVNLRDAGDPVEIARAYDEAGADELCFLDITASHVQRMLDDVAGDLIGDMALLQRHGEALQRFDNACQILSQLSAILKAKDRPAAIAAVNLEALRNRLLGKAES